MTNQMKGFNQEELVPDFIQEEIIIPLNDLGFKLQSKGSISDDENEMGIHTYIFNKEGGIFINDLDEIEELLNWSDDGQPESSFFIRGNYVYLIIPFTA